MKNPRAMKNVVGIIVGIVLTLWFVAGAWAATKPAMAAEESPKIVFHDNDGDGKDSVGDDVVYGNGLIELRFEFVNLSSKRQKAEAKYNGYFLAQGAYRGEVFFRHPEWRTEREWYPSLLTNDVVGLTAMTSSKQYVDTPFLWMWHFMKEPLRNMPGGAAWVPDNQGLPSYEWYTLYEIHGERDGALVFASSKKKGRREELVFRLDGKRVDVRYRITNSGERTETMTGILAFPANRIISTVYAPPEATPTRKIPPTGFTDHYTFRVENTDGVAGSGMLFWARGEDSLLHMDGMFSWHSFRVKSGETVERRMTVGFIDKDIDSYYRDYLAAKKIKFDTIDWDGTERYMVSKMQIAVMPEGWVYHAYDYNPPGTNHDWHNEMTGRAFIVKYLDTGDKQWLDYTTKANRYYLDRMYFNDPGHVCYGYFRDQSFADKLRDCYPWSQPYNTESLIAEYAITKNPELKRVLLLQFEKMYDGPLYNAAGKRWYWTMDGTGKKRDFGVFDAQEFGIDVMISAYEFTGERKYLDRAIEVMERNRQVLDNFGLLLEDRAGEPSVNTFAFAAKVLFKLYEYTGNPYYEDRAARILNATLYSRVFMEPYGQENLWLNGALARKDGDWKGQFGGPTTGTDSSVPSETTYTPWVMEALVAGYNHTGNEMYIRYIGQLLHHQLEANERLKEATGGKAELCGHYNMYFGKFEEDNDGLTVVSNLFLFPYVRAFRNGVRSPHSSVVLLPVSKEKVRVFHLSGRSERVRVVVGKVKSVTAKVVGEKGGSGRKVQVKSNVKTSEATFEAGPYEMVEVTYRKK